LGILAAAAGYQQQQRGRQHGYFDGKRQNPWFLFKNGKH
jgi:hypothetical protein